MRSRFFWLTLLLLAGSLVWLWLRQRRDDFAEMATQFTRPAAPPPPPSISEAELSALFGDTVEPAPTTRESFGAPSEATGVALPDPLDRETVLPEAEPELAAQETIASVSADDPQASEPSATPEEGDELEDADTLEGVIGYCVRCRAKREMDGAQEEITENGRRAARGTCPVCGTTMFRFLKEAG